MTEFRRRKSTSLLSTYTSNLGSALDRNRVAKAEKAKLAEAERTSQVTSQFIANMSHELRTPLNSIVGFSDMLSKFGENPNLNINPAEYGQLINQSAMQLLSIINEILDISKIQSDQYSLTLDSFTLDEILEDCFSMLQLQIIEKEIDLQYSIEDTIPELLLDPTKIRQVFTNIVGNAVKFTPKGGSVTIIAHLLAPNQVQISIADNGVGMSIEEIGLAMTPFGQVTGDLSRDFQGTGLGLPIAKALIEMHGGDLEVNSEKGKGSIFDILLPVEAKARKNN